MTDQDKPKTPRPKPRRTSLPFVVESLNALGGEPLKGSGFENEEPEPEFSNEPSRKPAPKE